MERRWEDAGVGGGMLEEKDAGAERDAWKDGERDTGPGDRQRWRHKGKADIHE